MINERFAMKTQVRLVVFLVLGVAALAAWGSFLLWAPDAIAQEVVGATVGKTDPAVAGWGYLGAAVATGLSALGAGIAVAAVGSAAVGALAEKPELFGRVMILVGLAEGIAIYGVIISVLILDRLT
jgi:V/A-type H+-transporting ATPase subunit K